MLKVMDVEVVDCDSAKTVVEASGLGNEETSKGNRSWSASWDDTPP